MFLQRNSTLRLHAVCVFLLSLSVYLITLSPGVTPGRSANVIVRAAQLEPVNTYTSPIYYLTTKVVLKAFGSIAGPATLLNLVSAVCGALVLSLMFMLVASIPHDRTSEETRSYTPVVGDSIASAWLAVIAALFSAPMWWASTRAFENTFGLCILMTVLLLVLTYRRSGRYALACTASVLIGLGCNELPAMVILLPVLGASLVFFLWVHQCFTVHRILQMAACFLLGWAFCLLNAWMFMQTDMYDWAGFSSFIEVLRVIWRDQFRALSVVCSQSGLDYCFVPQRHPIHYYADPKTCGGFSGSWQHCWLLLPSCHPAGG